MAKYKMEPVNVERIETKYRRIVTPIPVPESLPIFEALELSEPVSMMGQPPVIWDRAEGFCVYDRWGNRWLDWSSCVLVSNVGHGRPEIVEAVCETARQGLLATYVFVHEKRAALTRALQKLAPDPERYRVFLLTTGSEATENCIKLAKTYALEKHGPGRRVIVTFENAFHGRTLGAQLAGGMPKLKRWIGCSCPDYVQVPFPDGFKNEDTSFELFLKTLEARGVAPERIAGVMSETYQGVGPDFLPADYARRLEAFCREHDIVLIMDEVQAGFGRTGRMFAYEHYGIAPDLVACGKGISSSLPLAAVIGREDIMGLYAPGSMTSTHSASPLPVAAALENLKILEREDLVGNAARLGEILAPELERIRAKHSDVFGCVQSRGLVAGLQVVKPGTKEPDPDTALRINERCMQKGLLMFAPVGVGGECIKIAPPLNTTEEALREGIDVLDAVCDDVLS